MTATPSLQPSFAELGSHLATTTFVVLDLETTGAASDDTITEVGAVKVCGGEVLGEFQTLVNPGMHIPPVISVLTGITDAMVAGAPRLSQVMPPLLEFLKGAVLVAHNARFDVGFLRRACQQVGHDWPNPLVVDTVALARGALLRDEVPNVKLATLARHFRVAEQPNHRALTDARATVDVLHGLIERVGNLGVDTVEDLLEFVRGVSPERRSKRVWARDLPDAPGVYRFYADLPDGRGGLRREVLYVGKSVSIRARVRSYFTAAEKRSRMEEMLRIATGVDATVCRTPLEAEVMELRLIATHAPRYNRRSKFPANQTWLKLTTDVFPRLSLVRQVADDGATYFGPFARRATAELAQLALHDAFPIRQCTSRLSPTKPRGRCALGDLGRCLSPCDGSVTVADYATLVDALRTCLTTDLRPVLTAHRRRLALLVSQQRFEEAGQLITRLETVVRAATRRHRLSALAQCPQIVAAEQSATGWQIHVIRHGRLAAAALARPGDVPQVVARAAVAASDMVAARPGGVPAATTEEAERIAAWLERPGVRLIEIEGEWSWPLHCSVDPADLPQHLVDAEQAPAASALVRIGA